MKIPNKKKVREFLRTHRTYWERLDISDSDCCKYFNISEVPTKLKNKVYHVYSKGLEFLLDELDNMEFVDYDLALFRIKQMGFCLPIRKKDWGWQEPLTLDDLEDYLKRMYDRWNLISSNALERLNHIKKNKQAKISDYEKKDNSNEQEE